jgi:6-phosphogluconolactonase
MLEVFADVDSLTEAAALRFGAAVERGIAESQRCCIALSGGATPAGLFRRLALPPYADGIPWERVHLCWGDERCVPPEHPESNYRLVRKTLLDRVPVPPGNVHRMAGELEPERAARDYEAMLRLLFGTPSGAPKPIPGARFDLVLLGLGLDGHTASLFPRLGAVREQSRWTVAEFVPSQSMWRLTLTPVVFNAAAEVLFLVAGRPKAGILKQVLKSPPRPELLPAQSIAPTHGRLSWLVDAPAAETSA